KLWVGDMSYIHYSIEWKETLLQGLFRAAYEPSKKVLNVKLERDGDLVSTSYALADSSESRPRAELQGHWSIMFDYLCSNGGQSPTKHFVPLTSWLSKYMRDDPNGYSWSYHTVSNSAVIRFPLIISSELRVDE